MDQHRAALDVGEELVPQPRPLGRAFDQPRDVGDHRLAILAFDRPQHRRERRERVVGHLRRRPRQPPQQRGLARVRQPDQPDVGQQFQPQLDPVRLPARPLLGKPRRLPGRGREPLVPMPPTPPMRHHSPLPRLDEVDRTPIHRHRLGPGRHRNHPLLPPPPMPVRPFPMPPPLPRKCLLPFKAPRSRFERSQTSTTSPPCPPSPPSGPPRGTCASRRKLTQPFPPAPPSTQIFALSYIEARARALDRPGRCGQSTS